MNKQEFLTTFQMRELKHSTHQYKHPTPVKSAAVLIPLVEYKNQLYVILTTRALHLKHHPGQVSFPGGKVEDTDDSLVSAALRETDEEIGISSSAVDVVGQLHDYQTISGFSVTPIIGFVSKHLESIEALQVKDVFHLPDVSSLYKLDENEVDEIFHVPLIHFLDENNHHTLPLYHKGKKHLVNYMPYKSRKIWGATAAILKDLVHHLN